MGYFYYLPPQTGTAQPCAPMELQPAILSTVYGSLPPFAHQDRPGVELNVILAAWDADAASQNSAIAESLPGERFGKTPTPVTGIRGDNPPWYQEGSSPEFLTAWAAWQADADMRNACALDQLPSGGFDRIAALVALIILNPPWFQMASSPEFLTIYKSWLADADAQNAAALDQLPSADFIRVAAWITSIIILNPPWFQASSSPEFRTIYAAWQAELDAQNAAASEQFPGQRFGKVPTGVTAIRGDNPPPYLASANQEFLNILAGWKADSDARDAAALEYEPTAAFEKIAALITVFIVLNPPWVQLSSTPEFQTILAAWQALANDENIARDQSPDEGFRKVPTPVTARRGDNPIFGQPPNSAAVFENILAGWLALQAENVTDQEQYPGARFGKTPTPVTGIRGDRPPPIPIINMLSVLAQWKDPTPVDPVMIAQRAADLIKIISTMGVVIDPGIISMTAKRLLRSVTGHRGIQSITAKPGVTIH